MNADIRNQNLYAGCISTVFGALLLTLTETSSVVTSLCEALMVAVAYGLAATEAEKHHRGQPAFWVHCLVFPLLIYGPALAMPSLRPHFCMIWLAGVLTYSVRNMRSPLLRIGEPILGTAIIWLAVAWSEPVMLSGTVIPIR